MNLEKYSKLVSGMQFYKINKKLSQQKVVGNFRIKKFVARDQNYRQSSYFNNNDIYWGINPEILHKLMELKNIFAENNNNWNEMKVTSGHRSLARNEKMGGASKSRHILGEAVDLHIGDIDRDGQYTEEDKNKVLRICDKRLIGDKGVIGKYPDTRVIHIDVRGYRARWDTY